MSQPPQHTNSLSTTEAHLRLALRLLAIWLIVSALADLTDQVFHTGWASDAFFGFGGSPDQLAWQFSSPTSYGWAVQLVAGIVFFFANAPLLRSIAPSRGGT